MIGKIVSLSTQDIKNLKGILIEFIEDRGLIIEVTENYAAQFPGAPSYSEGDKVFISASTPYNFKF